MLDFNIDSQSKKITLKVSLKGEPEPLLINVNHYEIIEQNDKTFLYVKDIITSKEWMNLVIEDFVKEHNVEIPSKFKGIAKMIL